MTDRDRSGGRRPSNCGRGCGVGGRALATINSPTSTIYISTLESTIPIEEPKLTFVGELIPTIPSVVATPLTLKGSLVPEYLSLHSEHLLDQRPLLQLINKE
ncbi:hypothetical protein CR513_50467, partial [Mucuna pruriens]